MPQCLAPCIIPQIEEGVASEAVGEKVRPRTGLMQRSHVERKDFGVLTIIISVFKVTHGDQIFINCTENYEVLKLLQIQREWKRYGHYI